MGLLCLANKYIFFKFSVSISNMPRNDIDNSYKQKLMEPLEVLECKERNPRMGSLTTAALRDEPENNQPLSSFLIRLSAVLTFLEDKIQ